MEYGLKGIFHQALSLFWAGNLAPGGEGGGGAGGELCPQPTRMCEYESDGHGSVLGSKRVK